MFETLLEEKRKENLITKQEESKIRDSCIKCIKGLVSELRKRLTQNIKVLKQISIFSINNTLNPTKEHIFEILENRKKSSEIDTVEKQWKHCRPQM